jgi:hypothetical protein
MSYSFNARSTDKAELKAAVSDKLDGVERDFPIHKADRSTAQDVAETAIDLLRELPEGDTREYSCTVSGHANGGDDGFDSLGISVTASLLAKPSG